MSALHQRRHPARLVLAVFEKLFPIKGQKPLEAIHRLLAEARRRECAHNVTLGTPPFRRNWLNKITAVRLRFTRGADEP